MKFLNVKILSIVFCLSLALSAAASAEEDKGKTLFESMKCNKCHTEKGTPKGPSLQRIANTYGDETTLLQFFEGKSEPIVEPERAKTMKPRRRKIKKLSEGDKNVLAGYIISFKATP